MSTYLQIHRLFKKEVIFLAIQETTLNNWRIIKRKSRDTAVHIYVRV